MMTQPQSEVDNFHERLTLSFDQLASDSLQKIRAKSWDHYLELGLPSRKTEAFRYVKLRNLYEKNLQIAERLETTPYENLVGQHLLPECSETALVFVNGFFEPSLSKLKGLPAKAAAIPLSEAMKAYSTFLTNSWGKSIKEETDPFAALNAALHGQGAFIYLPPKTIARSPLQLLHIIDAGEKELLILPRLHLFVGSQSEIELCTTQVVCSGSSYFINGAIDFSLEEDSHVRYVSSGFDESQSSWHFEALRAHLKRNCRLLTVDATNGSGSTRNDFRIALMGENGEALLNGVWMLDYKNESHTHVIMDHQAPHCRSLQLFKGALNDCSHSSFEGKILVRQAAQKTDAFQLNNNLLLSEGAAAESKPNLEIFADDVKASHGSTVGQLDKEQLFYMKTRGFSDSDAKNLLVRGFCEEVIQKIEIPTLRQLISSRASSYLIKR